MKSYVAILLGAAFGVFVAQSELVVLNTFNGGELSPHINARIDFKKYKSGCRRLENMICLPYGGVQKRSGTQYIAETKNSGVARLISMSIGVDQSYILEAGHEYIRFYADGVQIQTSSVPVEVVTPYSSNDVFTFQTAQFANEMYFTHPDYPVYKLTRETTDPTFIMEKVEWDYPPLLKENDDSDHTLQVAPFGSLYYFTLDCDDSGADGLYEYDHMQNGKPRYEKSGYSVRWNNDKWQIYEWPGDGELQYSTDDTDFPDEATGWTGTSVTFSTKTNGVIFGLLNEFAGGVIITSSEEIFTEDHIGSVWEISHPRTNNVLYIEGKNDFTSDSISVKGDWEFVVSGRQKWTGVAYLEVSDDDGESWAVLRQYFNDKDSDLYKSYERSGTETENDVFYRVRFDEETPSHDNYCVLTFTVHEPWHNGLVEITGFASSTVVTGTVDSVHGIVSTNETAKWSEAAFSDERGHPRSCEFYENRLMLGNTEYEVNTIWGSKTDLYDDFELGLNDDDGLQFEINSDNVVLWMIGRDQLYIGTLGSEWIISGGDDATPLNFKTVKARRQSSYGSQDGLGALLAAENVIYVQRQGRKVREFEFSLEADKYKSNDTTLLAEHITESGIIQYAEQQQPQPIIWFVRDDGILAGLTYNKEQNVYGWHRHTTDGDFESAAVIPSSGEDRVYLVVNRINGRFIEWFTPLDWGSDDEDAWFVDSGLDYDGAAKSTFSNLTHLSGQDVSVLADGTVHTNVTVSTNGVITLSTTNSRVIAGLPFTARVSPMHIEVIGNDSFTYSYPKTLKKVVYKVNNSGTFKYGVDTNSLWTQEVTLTEPWLDGDYFEDLNSIAPTTRSPEFWIVSDKPVPLELLSISLYLDATGMD